MSKASIFVLYLLFAVVAGASLFLGYTYLKETGSLFPENKSLLLDSELIEILSEKTEIEWEDMLVEAHSDCEPVEELKFVAEQEEYFGGLKRDMFAAVNTEENIVFYSFGTSIPRTSTCWAIWVGDNNGVGFGGYRLSSGDVKVYSIKISNEVLEEKVLTPRELDTGSYEN